MAAHTLNRWLSGPAATDTITVSSCGLVTAGGAPGVSVRTAANSASNEPVPGSYRCLA